MDFWNEQNIKEALPNAKTYNFPENWSSNGMVIWQDNFLPGNMILMRTEGENRGAFEAALPKLLPECAAILSTKPARFYKYNKPIIEIEGNSSNAIINMCRYIRTKYQGKVIGVTGSSGKSTTTQMLLNIFSAKFKASSNVHSRANTSWGIAWNMTRFNIDDDYWIVETSLGGGMSRNGALVKPDCAIVTNVAPVHLTGNMTLKDIAEEKSKIFNQMKEGSVAAIYEGMEFFDIVKNAAEFKGLKVLTFGDSESAYVRIIDGDEKKFVIEGKEYSLGTEVFGHHILLDMAAALAIVKQENYPLEDAIEILKNFKTLEGRGEEFSSLLDGNKIISVTDEAYNANPLSMAAAITAFGEKNKDRRKILILGDMAECGEETERYHREIAVSVDKANPQKIILCGKDIKYLMEEIKDRYDVIYTEKISDIPPLLNDIAQDGDAVLLKSSHSGSLHTVVTVLKLSEVNPQE